MTSSSHSKSLIPLKITLVELRVHELERDTQRERELADDERELDGLRFRLLPTSLPMPDFMGMRQLGAGVLLRTYAFLDVRSMLALGNVCRSCSNDLQSKNHLLWRLLLQRDNVQTAESASHESVTANRNLKQIFRQHHAVQRKRKKDIRRTNERRNRILHELVHSQELHGPRYPFPHPSYPSAVPFAPGLGSPCWWWEPPRLPLLPPPWLPGPQGSRTDWAIQYP